MAKLNNEQSGIPLLSDEDFLIMSKFIHEKYGIKIPLTKKVLLETRLRKRISELHFSTFTEYREFVFSAKGSDEVIQMIDAVSTNKTEFFREPHHFDFLVKTALPDLAVAHGAGIKHPLMVWSAGCSSGEEPYSLAVTISEFSERYPGFPYEYIILATDISTKVLDIATRAVYGEDRIEHIPVELRKKYLLRSRDPEKKVVRIDPMLRDRVRFRRMNLMDDDFGFREPMDIIFCRNVIIYFDAETQEYLMRKFFNALRKGGFLFLGHSETIQHLSLPFETVAPTVYRKK